MLKNVDSDSLIFRILPFPDQIKALLDRQEGLHKRQSELKALLEECEASKSTAQVDSSVATDDWSADFEWDSRAEDIRFNVFSISSYRANQREVSILL